MVDKIGGRKVLVVLVTLALGLAITLWKGDIPSGLLSLIQVLFGAFIAGNGVEHIAGVMAASRSSALPEAADGEVSNEEVLARVASVEARIEAVHTDVQASQTAVNKVQETLIAIIQRAFPQG
jgi:hypothetical protein